MGNRSPEGVSIRVATPADHVAVSRVLDGALLESPDLQGRLAGGTVLVATIDGPVVGAIVLVPDGPADPPAPEEWPEAAHVESIAVRRKHRRAGIGTALLRAARERWAPLVADFDERVDPFYAALGAERHDAPDGRRWALLREP